MAVKIELYPGRGLNKSAKTLRAYIAMLVVCSRNMGLPGPRSYKAHHPKSIIERKINVHNKYLSWLVKLRKVPRNSSCVLTKKNVSAVEHTPIPVVLGSSIAIGQSLSMVVLQRSSGTRSRPVKKESLYHCIFRVGSS